MVTKVHYFTNFRSLNCFIRLIINESLEVGSQLDYILHAQANGYAVIVTNTNLNTDESSKSVLNASRRIRVSLKTFTKCISLCMNYSYGVIDTDIVR